MENWPYMLQFSIDLYSAKYSNRFERNEYIFCFKSGFFYYVLVQEQAVRRCQILFRYFKSSSLKMDIKGCFSVKK